MCPNFHVFFYLDLLVWYGVKCMSVISCIRIILQLPIVNVCTYFILLQCCIRMSDHLCSDCTFTPGSGYMFCSSCLRYLQLCILCICNWDTYVRKYVRIQTPLHRHNFYQRYQTYVIHWKHSHTRYDHFQLIISLVTPICYKWPHCVCHISFEQLKTTMIDTWTIIEVTVTVPDNTWQVQNMVLKGYHIDWNVIPVYIITTNAYHKK